MEVLPWKWLLFGVISALAAWIANRGRSAYHDGLRPLMPEYRRGELSHRQAGRKAYDISIGFILFYALPFTIANGVMVSHTIFLAADVIGVILAGPLLALLAGGVYGFGVSTLLDLLLLGLSRLPVNFLPHLGQLLQPLGYMLGLMPVVAVFQLYGKRLGAASLLLVVLARWAAGAFQTETLLPGLTADGITLAVGSVFLIALALRRRGAPFPGEVELFADNLRLLRGAAPVLLLIGACAALAANAGWLAGEPAAALLLGGGRPIDAALVALFSAVGFMPLVVSSSVVSGAYSTQGYPDWVLGAGYLAASPIGAALAGAGIIAIEVFGLPFWMRLLGRFPDLRELGGAVRDSMTIVTELALLIGGFVSANAIWPGYGLLIAGGMYFLNETAGRPVIRLAIAPVAAIAVGLLVNLATLAGM